MTNNRLFTRNVLFVFLLIFSVPCFAEEPCSVSYIPAHEYSQVVVKAINNAQHSVHAVLYLFSLYPNSPQSLPMQPANALVAAQKRGVNVNVVLDKGEYASPADPGAASAPSKEDSPSEAGRPFKVPAVVNNLLAYEFLAGRGVHVRIADVTAIVHAKAMVIDSQTVIVGSVNWSESALSRNFEASVLINSTDVAKALLRELGALPEKTLPSDDSGAVRLPMRFLSDSAKGGCAGRMAANSDERAYDVYLYLHRLASAAFSSHRQPSPSSPSTVNRQPSTFFDLNYDSCASQLGIVSMGNVAYRRQINKVLEKLQDRYGLVSVSKAYGQDAQIRFTSADTTGGTVSVPAKYWDFGWGRSLGFPGKVMYVLNLYYSSVSLSRPQWSMAETTLAGRHGLTRGFVTTGIIQLRRANLFDVVYDENMIVGPRHSNRYFPLPLYDPALLAAEWTALENRYGKEKTDRGRACAAAVYKDDDCGAVEKFIELENKYGIDKVEKARKIMEEKDPDNPKRCVAYFVRTIMGNMREPISGPD